MGQDKLSGKWKAESGKSIILAAEDGASLSSGSLRLYALPYGCVDIYNYDPLNRRAAVGIMVATEYRRQGYALAMLEKLEELFSGQWTVGSEQWATQSGDSSLTTDYCPLTTLHTLYADIAVTNTASLALFAKAGYSECGRFKEWLNIDGRYIDSIRMQKLL